MPSRRSYERVPCLDWAAHPGLGVCRCSTCSRMSSWKATLAVHPQHTPAPGGRTGTLLASASAASSSPTPEQPGRYGTGLATCAHLSSPYPELLLLNSPKFQVWRGVHWVLVLTTEFVGHLTSYCCKTCAREAERPLGGGHSSQAPRDAVCSYLTLRNILPCNALLAAHMSWLSASLPCLTGSAARPHNCRARGNAACLAAPCQPGHHPPSSPSEIVLRFCVLK